VNQFCNPKTLESPARPISFLRAVARLTTTLDPSQVSIPRRGPGPSRTVAQVRDPCSFRDIGGAAIFFLGFLLFDKPRKEADL
jgi:hypothetical protein